MPTFRAEGPGGLHGPVLVVLCDPGVGGGRARPDRAVTLGSLCPSLGWALFAHVCPAGSEGPGEQRRGLRAETPRASSPPSPGGPDTWGSLGTHSADSHTSQGWRDIHPRLSSVLHGRPGGRAEVGAGAAP